VKQKVLLFDIETSPSLGYVWGKYQQDVIEFDKEWYILSFSAKWLNSKVFAHALPDYPTYKRDPENDKLLVKDLWKLFNEADILIAHNGDQFDVKKANARFAYHNLPPPAPYKTVDTLKIARRYFKFTSNKLDDLGKHLRVGRKVVHTGFHLWQGCMRGDKSAWKKMLQYNKQDVILLEAIYYKLRPWLQNHPPLAGRGSCSNCGSPTLISRGYGYNKRGRYFKYQCKTCYAWSIGSIIK
jgi:DNA polymerase elongation subunit (family B)